MRRATGPALDVEAMFDRMLDLAKSMTVNEAHESIRADIFALRDSKAVDVNAARRLTACAVEAHERVCRTVLSRSR